MSQVAPRAIYRPQPRVEDERYRRTFKDTACESCGNEDGTVIPAHVRRGHEGGIQRKPDDALTVGLCGRCHAEQEATPGEWWWFENVFKKLLRRRYDDWKMR